MQDHLPHYLREVSDLCAIDSGTYDKAGVDRVALCLAERLRRLGMEVSLYEQEKWGNDVYAILHGSGQGKVTLLGHIDTVYPAGTAAARPVQVRGREGKLCRSCVCNHAGFAPVPKTLVSRTQRWILR